MRRLHRSILKFWSLASDEVPIAVVLIAELFLNFGHAHGGYYLRFYCVTCETAQKFWNLRSFPSDLRHIIRPMHGCALSNMYEETREWREALAHRKHVL